MSETRTLIVGAGAAGAVIAARLTERPDRAALLLEAGPDYLPDDLPPDLADGTRNSLLAHDWGFQHRPTRGAWPIPFPLPRGKVVGGSSAVNTCIALRGTPADYDEWAALGLSEWSWDEVLPYFRRLERDLDFGDRPWHGADGPLPIRRHPASERSPWQEAFLEACALLGFPRADDHNAPDAEGYGPHAMNHRGWRRVSAAEAWLTPAVRARDNLAISPRTLARRVVFAGRRAVGVEVERAGVVEVLHADRIVLCAGALCTPGLLMRSGVGPRAEVARLGVPLVADRPGVGARLLDHPGSATFFRPRRGAGTSRRDPLIATALRTRARGDDRLNTLQIQAGGTVPFPWVDLPLLSIMDMLGKPHGQRRLRIPSADPHARPIVEGDLLADARDRERLIDGLRLGARLADTAPMRALARPLWPGARILGDDVRAARWIRWATDSGYHPSGTAPMGPDDDPLAVTDGRGRVRGVDGLYVADASLMPTIPTSNIHLPTLMIGERIGEWLREG